MVHSDWLAMAKATSRRLATLAMLPFVRGYSTATQVAEKYTPLRKHATLFSPARVDELLHPEFLAMLQSLDAADLMGTDPAAVIKGWVTEEAAEIYSFPLLTEKACDMLCDEVEHFQTTGLPVRRPNSMNNYGIILNEIGLKEALSVLQSSIAPVARALFPVEGQSLDDHHSFVVSYKPSEDKGLDMHTDDSDCTLNVCLGKEFEAAGLTFCGNAGAPEHRLQSIQYSHARGRALLHLGRRRHGADDITEGHRLNLIMWNYNAELRRDPKFRARPFFVEKSRPDPVCVSFTHDRDYEAIKGQARPEGHEKFARLAWCPPPAAEYAGFEGTAGRYRDLLDESID